MSQITFVLIGKDLLEAKGDLGSRTIIIVENIVILSLSQLHSEKIGYVSLNNKKIGEKITSMTLLIVAIYKHKYLIESFVERPLYISDCFASCNYMRS